MVLPLALAGVALGGLLGGGGTQVTQTQTLNNSSVNAFNPVINFGGDTGFAPATPVENAFTTVATTSQTQEQANPADLLSVLDPTSGAIGAAGAVANAALGAVTSGGGTDFSLSAAQGNAAQAGLPIELIAIGGAAILAAAFFLPKQEA